MILSLERLWGRREEFMENLLGQGVELAVFGMGTVFVFLTLLIGATSVMSTLLIRFAGDHDSETGAAMAQDPANSPRGAEDPRLIAVITAAINQHRSQR